MAMKQQWLQPVLQRFPTLDARLQQLSPRERILLSTAGVLLALVCLYLICWRPLQSGLQQRAIQVEAQQQLLQWVRENTGRYQSLQQAQGTGGSGKTQQQVTITGSLTERMTRLASVLDIELTRLQPQNDSLVIVIDQAPFDALLKLLEATEQQAGLTIEQLDVAPASQPGEVRVRRLQVRL